MSLLIDILSRSGIFIPRQVFHSRIGDAELCRDSWSTLEAATLSDMRKLAVKVGFFVLVWIPIQLAWNAVLGWGDDQLAAWFGIKSPTASQVNKSLVEFGPSLVVVALAFYLYHLWWSRQAGARAVDGAQQVNQLRLEEPQGHVSTERVPSVYFTAYETVHYLADESQWGSDISSYISPDGLKKNPLLEAPGEFRARAAEGRVRTYGASPQTGQHELIPKTHWMSYGFDFSTIYHSDAVGSSAPATFEAGFHGVRDGKHIYADLKIEAADVYQVWPRRNVAESEFDAAFAIVSLSRDEAIRTLWDLRKAGVAIRNEPVLSEQFFPAWKAKYEQWRSKVLLVAEKVDENLRPRLEVLDQVRRPPNLPVINQDHALCIRIASEILSRLEERLP